MGFIAEPLVLLAGVISAVVGGIIGVRALRTPVSWLGVRKTYAVLAIPYAMAVLFGAGSDMLDLLDEWMMWLNLLVTTAVSVVAVHRLITIEAEPPASDESSRPISGRWG